jgi:hypothetical protein
MKTHIFLKKAFCLFVFTFLLLTTAKTALPVWGELEKGRWIELEISAELKNHLASLTEDERVEQCRDWVVLSFIQMLDLAEEEKFQLLYDFSPLRYDFLRSTGNFQYGESRMLMLAKGELVIFVAKNSSQRRNWIARQADEFALLQGQRPKTIRVVDYVIDPQSQATQIAYTEDVPVADAFSKTFGFVEEQVSNQSEMISFLAKTDDLVAAKRDAHGRLTLSGRRYENFQGKPLALEDVAVLYQADNKVAEQYVERIGKRGLMREYQNFQRQISTEEIDANIEDLNSRLLWIRMLPLSDLNLADQKLVADKIIELEKNLHEYKNLKTGLQSYESFKDFFKKTYFIGQSDGLNLGFSLDPQIKFSEFGRNLRNMANGDRASALRWYDETQRDLDKEVIVFEMKRAEESVEKGEEKFTDFDFSNLDLLTEREISGNTLLFGSDSTSVHDNKKREWVKFLARQFDVDEKTLQTQTDEIFENIWLSIVAYKELLLLIATQLETADQEDNNRLSLMLQLRRYAEDDVKINLNRSTNFDGSNDEARINRLIFSHAVIALRFKNLLKTGEYKTFTSEVEEAVRKFQRRTGLEPSGQIDNRTMLELLDAERSEQRKLDCVSHFLRDMQSTFSYQKARYDGHLQGTEVGMTLFYTDLVMKLWSFDFKNTSPEKAVFGFRSETNAPFSSVYKLDFDKNSSTRSWLGPLKSSYGFFNDGHELYFSHVASTIFNASSSDLFPGKESEANASSERFAQWWNSHYSEVADYEPEFHRLNQIMKWTATVQWLKINGQFAWLDEVQRNVKRDLEFSSWYQNNSSLRVHADIPFDDPKKHGETTECLEILKSQPYLPFADEFLIYSFSGGVSLVPKADIVAKIRTPRPVRIVESRMNRKAIDFSDRAGFSAQEVSFSNGTKYEVVLAGRKVNVSPAKNGRFRGADGELFGLNIERKVSAVPGKTVVSQKAGKIRLGELTAESAGGKIKLTAIEAEASQYHLLFSKANKNSKGLEAQLFENNAVEFAYKLEKDGRYLVKLKNTENSVLLRVEEIPVGPEAVAKPVQADYRHAFDSKNYLLGETQTPVQTEALLANRWVKVSPENFFGRNAVELTSARPPVGESKSLHFFNETYSNEVVKIGDDLYFKTTSNPTKDWQVADMLHNSGRDVLDQFEGTAVEGYIFSAEGRGLAFSRIVGDRGVLKQVEALFPDKKSDLKAIIFSSKGEVRLAGEGILEVPKNASREQAEVVDFINKKATEQAEFLKIFGENDAIQVEAVRQLKLLKNENIDLAKHYFEVDAIKNLESDMAFVDLRSASLQPQMVVKVGQSRAQVLTLDKTYPQSLAEAAQNLKADLLSGKNFTYQELMARTQQFNESQQAVARQTGAKKIVTAEYDGVNSELVNRLHNENPQTVFKRDQPDFERSVSNVSHPIPLEFEGSIFLSSAGLDSLDNDISSVFSKIKSSGLPCETGVTIERFEEIMADSNWKQITLVARVNAAGLVLSDGVVSFSQLESNLGSLDLLDAPDKDFIHLVTNDGFRLTQVFSESSRFQKIITSSYRLGNAPSLATTLDNVWSFYRSFSEDVCRLTKKELKKLGKKNPGTVELLSDRTRIEGKTIQIEVGKLSQKQKSSLSAAVWDFFGEKLFGKGKTYQPQTIESKLNETQMERLRQFKSTSLEKINPGVFPVEKYEP